MIFFRSLTQLCQAILAFSTLTVPGSHNILLLLGNTMSTTFYLGIVQPSLGTSIPWVHELHLLFLHTVLWALLTLLFFWFVTTTLCLVVDSWWLYTAVTQVVCLRQSAFVSYNLLPVSLLSQFLTACRVLPRSLWQSKWTVAPSHYRRRSMPCASTSNTWLCLYVYLPSAKAFVHADNTCWASLSFCTVSTII